jgi:hypothetical protein
MNTKQKVATGFLALVIVGSIAFMPVSAEVRGTRIAPASQSAIQSGNMVATFNTAELPQDQVKDLTYN